MYGTGGLLSDPLTWLSFQFAKMGHSQCPNLKGCLGRYIV